MTYVKEMLESHPWEGNVDRNVLAECIEECFKCSQTCTSCADACLSEDDVANQRKCIRLDLDCADICQATARVLSRQTEYDAPTSKAQLEACRQACSSCADECESHEHEHCQICAKQCRKCEQACERLLDAMK